MVKPAAFSLLTLVALLLAAVTGIAQAPPRGDFASEGANTPAEVEDNFLQMAGAQAHFEASNKLSEMANLVLARDRVISIPHFNSSFEFQSKTFRFTVVGNSPKSGQTTTIPTQIIPLTLFFEGYVDDNGDPIVLDAVPNLSMVANSPS